jgi:hypothetical protein
MPGAAPAQGLMDDLNYLNVSEIRGFARGPLLLRGQHQIDHRLFKNVGFSVNGPSHRLNSIWANTEGRTPCPDTSSREISGW